MTKAHFSESNVYFSFLTSHIFCMAIELDFLPPTYFFSIHTLIYHLRAIHFSPHVLFFLHLLSVRCQFLVTSTLTFGQIHLTFHSCACKFCRFYSHFILFARNAHNEAISNGFSFDFFEFHLIISIFASERERERARERARKGKKSGLTKTRSNVRNRGTFCSSYF